MSLVSKNIFWLTLSRVFALVLLFLAYRALFAYLGPFGSGQYQFVLSYVLIFSTVVDFGVQQFITKKMSEEPENIKKYFHNFFAFEAIASVTLYILLLVIAYLNSYEPVVFKAIAVTGLGMVANALAYPFLSVMTVKQDLRKVAFINFLNSVVNITIIFLAVWLKKYIIFLASIQLVFGILDFILYSFFIRKHLYQPQVLAAFKNFDFFTLKNILKSAWPFALLVGFSAIYNRIDIVIITQFLGYTQTGLYTAAYRIFDLLGFFPSAVGFALFPVFSSLMVKKAITEVRDNIEKYSRIMLMVALPMAVGGMVLSAQLIRLVAGSGFEAASSVLAILIWAPAILFIYSPASLLVISQMTKKALAITGANVLVNTIGNIILIPIYGIKAAAIMTVVSEALQGIFYFYFVRKNITVFGFSTFFYRPALGALVMGLVLWPLRNYFLLPVLLLAVAVYIVILILTGFLKKEDWGFLKGLFLGRVT